MILEAIELRIMAGIYSLEQLKAMMGTQNLFASYQPVLNHVLQKLVKIEEQNSQIIALLKEQRKTRGGLLPLKTECPIDHYDQLLDFIEEIEETQDAKHLLVSYLSSLGGEGVVSKTNRILKELMTDKLASEFNFCGGHHKRAFKELQIINIIIDAVKVTTKSSTLDIENAIKVWLKHAPQRIKIAAAKAEKRNRFC
ncbi:uncharacterized protein LOC126739791 [Anthonomus grandis grandis]|uniref:uncharacterized protein LOC126739791 n=1 Tax=Anthonomus grandis grandis TaxID=2921223 RepID=UPI002166415A|nr:uncharacterized protein LOC126739791 [Anthonomus grandis grandis]